MEIQRELYHGEILEPPHWSKQRFPGSRRFRLPLVCEHIRPLRSV
jgi:hypothetical protein